MWGEIIIVLTNFSWLEAGRGWPPTDEKARINRYDRCTLLFEGDHAAAFPGLNPTDDPRIEAITANWFKRSTTLIADLASPLRLFADNQEVLDRIAEANDVDLLVYDVFCDILKFGNAVLKVRFDPRRGGIIERIDPRYWFPVVSPDDGRDVQAHCICYSFSQYEDHIERGYLRVEIHRPGSIQNRLFRLDSGAKITSELPPSALERYGGLPGEIKTGIDVPLIVPLAGLLSSGGVFGLDDYGGIEGLVRELEKRLIRTSKTLDKFSDPNISGPEGVLEINPDTGRAEIEMGGGRYFSIAEGDPTPQFMVWDASLQSNFSQIEEIKSELMALGEISPALLGDTKNGLAESGSALKRLALPTLAKVARLRMKAKRPILRSLELCARLEAVSRFPGAGELQNLTIEWRSALPPDPVESATVEATRKNSNLTSTRSALARLDPDTSEKDLDWEEAKIAEEKAADALNFV